MASYKYHFRKTKKTDSDDGKLFIRVIHDRKFKDIATPHAIRSSEWDEERSRVIYHIDDPARNDYLADVESQMRHDLAALDILDRQWVEKRDFTAEELVGAFKNTYLDAHNILAYSEQVGQKLKEDGQFRTARAYSSAVRSLLIYRKGQRTSLQDISSSLMRDFESHLKKKGLNMNTISFYMRNLRALYYRAIEDRLIHAQPDNPFGNVYTGVYISRKRALNIDELRSLNKVQKILKTTAASEKDKRKRSAALNLQESLMYFNFCLEARGMSWVDMAFLKKADLKNDVLSYRRKKTGRMLDSITITPCMRKIIDYFAVRTANSPYVFPVIDPGKGNELRQYEVGLRTQNERLEIRARMAGIEKKVTTHVSRHTWATVARNVNLSIPVISELLGHSNINVTHRYLDALENDQIRQATERVTKELAKAS